MTSHQSGYTGSPRLLGSGAPAGGTTRGSPVRAASDSRRALSQGSSDDVPRAPRTRAEDAGSRCGPRSPIRTRSRCTAGPALRAAAGPRCPRPATTAPSANRDRSPSTQSVRPVCAAISQRYGASALARNGRLPRPGRSCGIIGRSRSVTFVRSHEAGTAFGGRRRSSSSRRRRRCSGVSPRAAA